MESLHYNKMVDGAMNNFVLTYYPATVFLTDAFEVIEVTDEPDCVIYELSMFNHLLSPDIAFNRCVFEIIFMFLSTEVSDENLDAVMEEIDSQVLESIVGSNTLEKYKHYLNRTHIEFVQAQISNLFYRPGWDALVVGWERNFRNLSVGVVYV